MKIQGWVVEGFGIFRNYQVRELPQGLTVFHGANEAGKSTLLAFLRGVLFGFPDRRSSQPQYPPLNGGRHGGRVVLAGPDGEYIVDRDAGRRSAARITLPDGRRGGEEDLRRLLAGADDQLFRSIFAFSLWELQSFKSLTADGVRDRIFSAGVAGAGRSARQVVGRLTERAKGLLKRSGKTRINSLVSELNTVSAAVEDARRAAVGYVDRLKQEEASLREVERVALAIANARRERGRYETMIELWPAWHELADAHAELERTDRVDDFPADADSRLASVLYQVDAAQRSLHALRAEQQQAEARRAELQLDDAAAGMANEVDVLHADLALHRDRLATCVLARGRLETTQRDLDDKLRDLGPGWDEARIEAFDRSVPKREEVRTWEQRFRHVTEREQQAQRERDAAVKRAAEVQDERDQVAASLPPATPLGAEELKQQEMAIRRVRANLADLRAAEVEADAKDRVVKDAEQSLRALESAAMRLSPRWIAAALWFLLALFTGGIVWRGVERDPVGVITLLVAAMAFGYGLERLRRWLVAREQHRRSSRQAIVAELEALTRARDVLRGKAEATHAAIEADSRMLGLPLLPSFHVVEEADEELARRKSARARWDDVQARMSDLDRTSAAAHGHVRSLEAGLAEAEQASATVGRQWSEWKTAAGIPAELSTQGVLDFFALVREAREAVQRRNQAREAVSRLERDVGAWEDRARSIIAQAGAAGAGGAKGEALVERVIELRRRCEQAREQQRLLAVLDEGINARRPQISAAEQELQRHQAERDHLFGEAAAADEEEFRRRRMAFQRRQELRRLIQDRERQIAGRIGQDPEAAAIQAALASGQVREWQRQIESTDEHIGALERQRDDAVKRHHDAERARHALEESADVATCEAGREGVVAELAAAVREWRVLTLAQGLIEETLREFERTRQPAVLAQASRTFSVVTHNRYERVAQEESGEEIVVVDGAGRRKRPDELSRGTAEQLYLCIRLGLAAEFAHRSGPLPLIMDDVLVNFDPGRARNLAAALADFAQEHQVLFFTCQPATRDLLVGFGGAARVVEMDRLDDTTPG